MRPRSREGLLEPSGCAVDGHRLKAEAATCGCPAFGQRGLEGGPSNPARGLHQHRKS